METNLADFIKGTPDGADAESILRKCVHCGFCTATCPTYQLLGDELDGPRGRIYLMKQMLEGAEVSGRTRLHLDRCLTCRSCETTCPSGVEYGRLLDIGRTVVDQRAPRGIGDRAKRSVLRKILPHGARFGALLKLGSLVRPLAPASLRSRIPLPRPAGPWPAPRHDRRALVLDGCVQPSLAPDINAAAARALDRAGVSLVAAPEAGCCGAVSLHLGARDEALSQMRRNVDAWMPGIDAGAEAIVTTASGCGATVREYGHHLSRDPEYADKARRVSELHRDLSEVIRPDPSVPVAGGRSRVAFQSPCTLQHGQQIRGRVEAILAGSGYELVPVPDPHLCCGSAGTYSLLQPGISGRLRERKLKSLHSGSPQVIATANIGCLSHLEPHADVPVRHWIELIAPPPAVA